MALKKSQLYSSLWQSCDELRGESFRPSRLRSKMKMRACCSLFTCAMTGGVRRVQPGL